MSKKSILDFEEARRRLKGMEKDHEELVELLSKLRKIRDNITKTMSAVEKRLKLVDTCIDSARDTRNKLQSALEHLEQVKEQVEDEANKTLDSIESEVVIIRNSLESKQELWINNQNAAFDKFKEQHHKTLEKVIKAYDRQKVVFDTIRTTVDSLEVSLEQVSKRFQNDNESLRSEMKDYVSTTVENFANTIKSTYKKLNTEIGDKCTALEAIAQEQFEVADNLRRDIQKIRNRLTRTQYFVFFLLLFLGVCIYYMFLFLINK
jgi:chromosome segregation ATPase